MLSVASLLLAVLFVAVFKKPLRKAPWVFYIVAVAFDVFVIASPSMALPVGLRQTVILAQNRCVFAFALFIIVMFTGVLKDGTSLKKWLLPIRAELSILVAILTAGHVVRYAGIYSVRMFENPASLYNGVLASFVVSAVLVVLLAVLTVTSFGFAKKVLGAKGWKRLQRLSYVFFGLIYVHILLIMLHSALNGGTGALVSIVTYGVVLVVYVGLRLRRYGEDRTVLPAGTPSAAMD